MAGIMKDPSSGLNIFLAVMCVILGVFIWYNPIIHRKKVSKATNENPASFKMTVYPSGIKIGEENGEFVLNYNQDITKIFKTHDLFLVCAGKERIFILPSRCIKESHVDDITKIYKDAMNENYIEK